MIPFRFILISSISIISNSSLNWVRLPIHSGSDVICVSLTLLQHNIGWVICESYDSISFHSHFIYLFHIKQWFQSSQNPYWLWDWCDLRVGHISTTQYRMNDMWIIWLHLVSFSFHLSLSYQTVTTIELDSLLTLGVMWFVCWTHHYNTI